MNATAYDKPLPEPTQDSQPFWDALREHRLVLQRCARCKKVRHYPRPVCDACYSMDCDWIEATGRGRVHSWTVCHHAFHPGFKTELPYLEVTVDLDEGVRMQSRLVDAAPEDLEVGMAVEVVYADVTSDTTLALFRPTGG